jgi:hypothetical protein
MILELRSALHGARKLSLALRAVSNDRCGTVTASLLAQRI